MSCEALDKVQVDFWVECVPIQHILPYYFAQLDAGRVHLAIACSMALQGPDECIHVSIHINAVQVGVESSLRPRVMQ